MEKHVFTMECSLTVTDLKGLMKYLESKSAEGSSDEDAICAIEKYFSANNDPDIPGECARVTSFNKQTRKLEIYLYDVQDAERKFRAIERCLSGHITFNNFRNDIWRYAFFNRQMLIEKPAMIWPSDLISEKVEGTVLPNRFAPNVPLENLALPTRTRMSLKRAGINNVHDLVCRTCSGSVVLPSMVKRIEGCGEGAYKAISRALEIFMESYPIQNT